MQLICLDLKPLYNRPIVIRKLISFIPYIALKKKVAGSTKFAEMSKNFVMVNSEVTIVVHQNLYTVGHATTVYLRTRFICICICIVCHYIVYIIMQYLFPKDDEEPDDELFDIDGSYVPRTFFIGKFHCI